MCLATGLGVLLVLMISVICDKGGMLIVLLVIKCFLSSPKHLSATGVSNKAADGLNGLPFLIAVASFCLYVLKIRFHKHPNQLQFYSIVQSLLL